MIETPPRTKPIARLGQLVALAVLAASAAASGCGKSTYLEIDFKGGGVQSVRQINLTIIDNTTKKYSAGVLPDDVDAASTDLVKFPVSVVFRLNDLPDGYDLPGGTPLSIKADAISPLNAPVAHAEANTTVMHGKTWKVTLDFALGGISLPLQAGSTEVPAGGAAASADAGAGGPPLGSDDDDQGEPAEDRPVIEPLFSFAR